MNKNIAFAAVALFAVTLGFAVLSPAVATKPDPEHKVDICHFAEAENVFNATGDGMWHNSTAGLVHLSIDNAGKLNGHFNQTGGPRHYNTTLGLMDMPTDSDGTDCTPSPIETVG